MIRVPAPEGAIAWVADRGFVGGEQDAAMGVERGVTVLRVADDVIVAPDDAIAALMRIDAELADLCYRLVDISEYMNERLMRR